MTDRSSGLTLVVVDDDSAIRRAIGRFLRSVGHNVIVFESAEAYLADRCAADCAILDVQMPGLNGFELEERLRQDGAGTPVIFITAHAELAGRARSCAPLLRKPIDEDGLLDAIASVTSARG
jgi:FixJ family two-component response regulator